MEPNQVQANKIAQSESSDNKEDQVILRTLVGDPNRHKPLAQHSSSNLNASITNKPTELSHASMYTLEPRNRSIPEKVLPKPIEAKILPKTVEAKVYYITTKETQQSSPMQDMPKIQEEPDKPMSPKHEEPKVAEDQKESERATFLEPKIILQPVLYSIVDRKNYAIENEQNISLNEDVNLPLSDTITDRSNLPPVDTNGSTPKVAVTSTKKVPHFYALIGNPNNPVNFVEQREIVPRVSKTSVSNFYTIIGDPQMPATFEKSVQPTSQASQESTATLYPIVGSPPFSLPIIPSNMSDPAPMIELDKTKPYTSIPMLYTIVGDNQVPNYEPIEIHPRPSVPIKKEVNQSTMYGVVGAHTIPSSVVHSIKNPTLPPIKQQVQPQKSQLPTLYTVIGHPTPPPAEDINLDLKRSTSLESPISHEDNNTQQNTNPEQKTHAEYLFETVSPTENPKNKRGTKVQGCVIPKSETVFIPNCEREPLPRPKRLRATPGKLRHKDLLIPKYDPLHLSDYISPYAYHPSKPYREQTYNHIRLPPLKNTNSERKERTTYETFYRDQRRNPYDQWIPHSLERFPVNTKRRSRLWDFERHAKTDSDDDDDDDDDDDNNKNETKSKRPKRRYLRIRIRTPWIPVW